MYTFGSSLPRRRALSSAFEVAAFWAFSVALAWAGLQISQVLLGRLARRPKYCTCHFSYSACLGDFTRYGIFGPTNMVKAFASLYFLPPKYGQNICQLDGSLVRCGQRAVSEVIGPIVSPTTHFLCPAPAFSQKLLCLACPRGRDCFSDQQARACALLFPSTACRVV